MTETATETKTRTVKPIEVEKLCEVAGDTFRVIHSTDNLYSLVVTDAKGRLCPLLNDLSRNDMRVSVDAMIVAYEFAGEE